MTLDQLAEQAHQRINAEACGGAGCLGCASIREALEAATKAQRQQQDRDCKNGECPGFGVGYEAAYVDHCDIRILEAAEKRETELEQQLAQVTQERDALRAALDIARALPFCDHADCAGGQHPARNCFGCEDLWARWREALDACAPTSS